MKLTKPKTKSALLVHQDPINHPVTIKTQAGKATMVTARIVSTGVTTIRMATTVTMASAGNTMQMVKPATMTPAKTTDKAKWNVITNFLKTERLIVTTGLTLDTCKKSVANESVITSPVSSPTEQLISQSVLQVMDPIQWFGLFLNRISDSPH